MNRIVTDLLTFLHENDGINDKAKLANLVAKKFELTRDRSVYYCGYFAIRFSASAGPSFANTVLSLSNLRKFDDVPFIVCLVTPSRNFPILSNTTFLKKVSHSSQKLRVDNIRGSFNGSDIVRDFENIANVGENLEQLYNIHTGIGFEGNLPRLVEATNNIVPSGKKFEVGAVERTEILKAPARAIKFVESPDSQTLKDDLDAKVEKFKNEILLAALIENVNVRGRIIEYLISGEDESLVNQIVQALQDGSKGIPPFKTDNSLGDYAREFEEFSTETDVKTKIMVLDSNPKAYNLDKVLAFLSSERSVFMFYFVGVSPGRIVSTVLVSIFQESLLGSTILLKHWSGRNSRGVSQFEGKTVGHIILNSVNSIDENKAIVFLEEIIAL